ncbi:MAG: M6 family metalloprotease domain-containing protein [Anaerovoracaceae bacterium]
MKKIITLFAILILAATLFPKEVDAMPAFNGIRTHTQPNGMVIKYRMQGDEAFAWTETVDGKVIELDENTGTMMYAEESAGEELLEASDVVVKNNIAPKMALDSSDVMQLLKEEKVLEEKAALLAPSMTVGKPSASGEQRVLVLLLDFTNIKVRSNNSTWSKQFFNPTTRSVSNYYKENSKGANGFKVVPAREKYGKDNDGIVRIKMGTKHPFASKNFSVFSNTGSQEVKIAKYVKTALRKSNKYVNFKQKNLHIVTIFAGYDASSASASAKNMVWAHNWNLKESTGSSVKLDGKRISAYNVQGEKDKYTRGRTTIGVSVHELGHSFGLPDLYDYNYVSEGLGYHSLMAAGAWGGEYTGKPGSIPTHLDAWSKSYLKFVRPETIISDPINFYEYEKEVKNTNTSTGAPNVIKVNIPGKSEQYFLIENRQLTGYDAGLKDCVQRGGIAIYHVDQGVISRTIKADASLNNCYNRKGVDLEESNRVSIGKYQLDGEGSNLPYDNYWYAGGINVFSPKSLPNTNAYSNAYKSSYGNKWSDNGTQNYLSDITITVVDSPSNNMRVKVEI